MTLQAFGLWTLVFGLRTLDLGHGGAQDRRPKIRNRSPGPPHRRKRASMETSRTHYRWVVCALLFFATTINYVDRQVFGILGPTLTKEFGWSETDFSFIVSAFTLAYAAGYLLAGRMMDRIGERKGFIVAVSVWSLAAMAHGLIGPMVYCGLPWLNAVLGGTLLGAVTPTIASVIGFSAVRMALGLAEGGNFPGAIKTVGVWHPKSERALFDRHFQQRPQPGRRGFRLRGAACGPAEARRLGGRVLPDRRVGLFVADLLAGHV